MSAYELMGLGFLAGVVSMVVLGIVLAALHEMGGGPS